MTRICSQCGNQNGDETKFCTSCGNALVPPTGKPAGSGIVIGAAIVAVIAIIATLVFLQVSGTIRILPAAEPAGTPQITPYGTSYIVVETPSAEPTAVRMGNLSFTTPVADTPVTRPTTPKPVVCPSDRRACGTNCTDVMTDVNNCGACGVSCGSTKSCQQGVCLVRCSYYETGCPDGCHNLSYDSQNCGTCGNICPFGLACNNSVCAPPVTTVIPTYIG
jgi:hypothetical protein